MSQKYFPPEPECVLFNAGYLLIAIADQSWPMVEELTENWHPHFKKLVWGRLLPEEREAIAKLKAEFAPNRNFPINN